MRIIICSILLCLTYQVSASNSMAYAEKHSLNSEAFDSSREYFVHLPESYESNNHRKYPVLYVLHGQQDTLGSVAVIESIWNDIPELIVIGVQSNGKELLPIRLAGGKTNEKGKFFRNFLLNELVPHVKQSYRVADFSILSGHSNAGRFVLNSLLDDPSQFNAYFAFSPSLEDNLINNRVKQEQLKLSATNTRLTITLANEGEHMEKPFRELATLLSEADKNSTFFHYKEYPEHTHGSTYLPSQLFSLRTLFKGWRPSWKIKKMGVTGVQKHYQELAVRFGFEIQIPSLEWLQMSFVLSRYESEEGDKKAEELVAFALKDDPNIADDFFHIVEELNENGFKQPAKNFHQLLCRKLSEHSECKGLVVSASPPKLEALPISSKEQARIVGRYRFDTDMSFTIFAENNRIFMQYLDDEKMEVFRIGDNQYIRKAYRSKFRFEKLKGDDSVSLVFGVNGETEHVRKRLAEDEILPFEYVINGNLVAAEPLYVELMKKNPTYIDDAELKLLEYADKLNTKDRKLALKVYQMCSRLFSTAQSFIKLASYYKQNRDMKNALATLKNAQMIEPKNPEVLAALENLNVKP